jgi:hypothetical protein
MSLGTEPDYRNRGIASALVLASCRSFAEADFSHAALGVDSANPNGAYRIASLFPSDAPLRATPDRGLIQGPESRVETTSGFSLDPGLDSGLLAADGLASRVHDPPNIADALPVGVADGGITGEFVEGPAVVSRLDGAVVTCRSSEQRGIDTLTGRHRTAESRPIVGACVVASRIALRVGHEEVEGESVGSDQDVT